MQKSGGRGGGNSTKKLGDRWLGGRGLVHKIAYISAKCELLFVLFEYNFLWTIKTFQSH
jgi:hypothetical protein